MYSYGGITYLNEQGNVDLASVMRYVKICRKAVNPSKEQQMVAQKYAQGLGKGAELPSSDFSSLKTCFMIFIGVLILPFRLILNRNKDQQPLQLSNKKM